ncbi:MAG TPA: hypothetical protein VHN77_09115 [Phycisphaerales bacterium]|nr:hypothetical protein [Phycisphaerales bacterium]
MHRSLPILLIMTAVVAATPAFSQTSVDATKKFSWSENCGWMNWADPGTPPGDQGMAVGASYLSGFVWCENIGWINLGNGAPTGDCGGNPCYSVTNGSASGVNMDPLTGQLSGFAWAENVGWINFSGGAMATPPNAARLDTSANRLRGFAWGENIGWINLDAADDGFGKFVGVIPGGCDDSDFNNDGLFPDTLDIDDFLSVFTGGPCSNDPTCGDIDFNNDGLFPDTLDIDSLLSVFSGGPCL